MVDARHSIVPLIFLRNALILLLLGVPGAQAAAQNPASAPLPDFVIPPPPKFGPGPGGNPPAHQGTLSTSEAGKAYDWTTKRHLRWDCDKRSWIDEWTGEAIGYDGYAGEDGEILRSYGNTALRNDVHTRLAERHSSVRPASEGRLRVYDFADDVRRQPHDELPPHSSWLIRDVREDHNNSASTRRDMERDVDGTGYGRHDCPHGDVGRERGSVRPSANQ